METLTDIQDKYKRAPAGDNLYVYFDHLQPVSSCLVSLSLKISKAKWLSNSSELYIRYYCVVSIHNFSCNDGMNYAIRYKVIV